MEIFGALGGLIFGETWTRFSVQVDTSVVRTQWYCLAPLHPFTTVATSTSGAQPPKIAIIYIKYISKTTLYVRRSLSQLYLCFVTNWYCLAQKAFI